jgi:zinc protease
VSNSNAQTKYDYTRYFLQLNPEGIEIALRYAADRLKADTAKISGRTIEYHRKNVLEEMNRQEASPLYGPRASHARAIATFGTGHPYGHGSYGTFEENKTFNAAQVKDWYTRNVYSENTVLFVVGNFNPSSVKQLIQKEFGKIPAVHKKQTPEKNKVFNGGGRFVLPASVSANFLSLSWPIAGYGSKDDPALYLLAYIVQSRLIKHLPSGMSDPGALELFSLNQLAGQFGLYTSFAEIADSSKAEAYLLQMINEIKQSGVTTDELDLARKSVITDTENYCKNLGFEGSRTELIGEGWIFANDVNYFRARIAKQSKITSKDIMRVTSQWLKAEPGKVMVVSVKS